MGKRSAPSTVKRSAPTYTDQVTDVFTTPRDGDAQSFRVFLDEQRGGIKANDHGNPNPLLRILPALYDGNFTVGQALAILFSGSPSNLSQEAIDAATNDYLTPTDKAIEAISTVLGLSSSTVSDQILQHNAFADPERAANEGNEYSQLLEEGSLEADPDLMGTATVEETIGPEEGFTTAPLPTPTPTDDKVEVDDIGGTELTEVDATAESTYTLPENEPVDVTKLPTEDQIAIWPQIQEALGGIAESVGKLLFGPKGIPTSIDEWLEWADETLQAQMEGPLVKAPLIITTTPDRGTWADVRIPVSFDADGTPIRIPLFDADGNFVGGEAIGESVRGQVLGPLEDVFIDKDGNITIDLPELGSKVLTDARINSDGNLTGTAATIGRVFFNTDTGEWEEGDGLSPETPTPATEEQDLPETQTRDTTVTEPPPPSSPPIVGEDEEETPPPTKGGKVGGRVITDKEGNVVEINRPDVIVGNGGETVLPGTTTVNEPVDNRLDDDIWNRGPGVGTTLEPAEVGEELFLEDPVVTTQDPVVTTQDPVVTTEDPVVGGPVITEGVPEDPIVGGPVIVEQGPEDPLVGTDDPIVEDPLVGTLSGGGGGGGGGGGLESGGYMGGLSYNLPGFVGVQYQPKDYTAQLNRIINESLFKGMI